MDVPSVSVLAAQDHTVDGKEQNFSIFLASLYEVDVENCMHEELVTNTSVACSRRVPAMRDGVS